MKLQPAFDSWQSPQEHVVETISLFNKDMHYRGKTGYPHVEDWNIISHFLKKIRNESKTLI
jgi:hypothetical protein